MTESEIPHLKEFPEFLAKYGNVKYEPLNTMGGGSRITAGDIDGIYNLTRNKDGELHNTYLSCTIPLPDINNGEPIMLSVVYKSDKCRRLDAWGERASIPFP